MAATGLIAASGLLSSRLQPPAQAATGPTIVKSDPELAEFLKAGIDWRQVAGEAITVMRSPIIYFDILHELTPHFTELTGINVNYEIVPPAQLRERHILDLSTKAGRFAAAYTDPMYYPLYAVNNWVEDLGPYLDDPKLTNKEWFDLPDIIPAWTNANRVDGKLYGMPYDGEVTINVYRKDLYTAKGIRVPDTLDEYMAAAAKLTDKRNNLYGVALRGFKGPGQNVYLYSSLFREYGGEWFDKSGNPTANSKAGVDALTYYVQLLDNYAPPGIANWNYDQVIDAFMNGTVAQYIDASSMTVAVADPAKSKVAGKVGFSRWPKGPTGKRVTSLWNSGFSMNRAIPQKTKVATWLWMQWLASKAYQLHSSLEYKGTRGKRVGVNRLSLWNDERFRKYADVAPGFVDTVLVSMREDTDVDWRPRVPQWPKIGTILATAVQKALVKQASPKEALDEANAQFAESMKEKL
jgi:multiple sugar transport system substrate-binding protein